jgi:hypothetical protein
VPKTTYLIMGQDLASTRQTRRHSPSTFARTRQARRHSPSHVARTRQTRRHSPKAMAYEKNVTRLDTLARVIHHFREFGASGHCLEKIQKIQWRQILLLQNITLPNLISPHLTSPTKVEHNIFRP